MGAQPLCRRRRGERAAACRFASRALAARSGAGASAPCIRAHIGDWRHWPRRRTGSWRPALRRGALASARGLRHQCDRCRTGRRPRFRYRSSARGKGKGCCSAADQRAKGTARGRDGTWNCAGLGRRGHSRCCDSMGRDELLRLSAWRIRTRQRRRRHLVRAARLEVVATAALPCGHLVPRAGAGPADRGNGRSNARTAADHLRTCLRASDDLTLRSSRHPRPVSCNRSSHLGYNRRRYWRSRRKCRVRLGHWALRTVGAVRSRLTHSGRCRRARIMEQPTGSASP